MHAAEKSAEMCSAYEGQSLEEERAEIAKAEQEQNPRNWTALRQHFEAAQAMKTILTANPIEVTEAFVRDAVARHEGIKPEDVPMKRVLWEVTAMLPHHPSIKFIPDNIGKISQSPESEEINVDTHTSRKKQVEQFLRQCNSLSQPRIYKRHIWQCVGHVKGRQFEFWQACSHKATSADHRNFTRILDMDP